jgi:hypothetical protein
MWSRSIFVFVFVAVNFVQYGFDTMKSGEVSPSFRTPLSPIVFGLAAAFFVQSLTKAAGRYGGSK